MSSNRTGAETGHVAQEWLSTAEAARYLGLTPHRIRVEFAAGRLPPAGKPPGLPHPSLPARPPRRADGVPPGPRAVPDGVADSRYPWTRAPQASWHVRPLRRATNPCPFTQPGGQSFPWASTSSLKRRASSAGSLLASGASANVSDGLRPRASRHWTVWLVLPSDSCRAVIQAIDPPPVGTAQAGCRGSAYAVPTREQPTAENCWD